MIKTIGNKEYEFNVKLGTALKIKKKFNKPFNNVLNSLDTMDIEDLIKLLHCGIDEQEVSLEEFKEYLLDNIGMVELYELVESFIKQIQYPGLTEEEIEKKIIEKNQKAQTMKDMISLKK